MSSDLNRHFKDFLERGLFDGKSNHELFMVFPSGPGFIDQGTGLVERAPWSRVCTLYPDILHSLADYKIVGFSNGSRTERLRCSKEPFKLVLKETINNLRQVSTHWRSICSIMGLVTRKDLAPLRFCMSQSLRALLYIKCLPSSRCHRVNAQQWGKWSMLAFEHQGGPKRKLLNGTIGCSAMVEK